MRADKELKLDAKTVARQARHQSRATKKSRRSGLKTEKPYISSSIGAIIRHMIRLACTQNTVGMTEPPPLEFYGFWREFAVGDDQKEPGEYVDKKVVSIAKLNQITSSFDFFGSEVSSINSANVLDVDSRDSDGEGETHTKSEDGEANSENYYSQLGMVKDSFGYLRESYSADSLLSHSTKADSYYEPELGEGFSDSYDDVSEPDSDDEFREIMQLQFGLNKVAVDYDTDEESSHESMSVRDEDAAKEKMRSRTKAKQAAIANAKAEQEKLAQEEEEERKRKDAQIDIIIRTGSNDSFLLDDYSYGTLSDSVFDSEFDFFNEKPKEVAYSTENEEEEDAEERKKRRKIVCRVNPKLDPERLAEEKRRIEENLREAVQCRSAMGMYNPPKGKKPLTKYFESSSPGPAAYYPQQKLNKGAIMTPRWKSDIYETLGPGPGAYNPASCGQCSATMINLHESERFTKSETVGPGPAVVNISPLGKTGKDKPHALLVPRRPDKKVGCGEGEFTNCYGLTRNGLANPPKALIISKHPLKDKSLPGPGAYDPEPFPDRRVGIIQKSRIPKPGPGVEPGYVLLPDKMGEAPKFSFGLRQFRIQNEDSPGPIYKVQPWKRKPLSLTFKPFPVRGRENEPSPIEYGTKAAEASIKVLPKAPIAVLTSRRFPNFENDQQPGPNHYNLQTNLGGDGPLQTGRYKHKIEILPGPADFVPNNSHFKNPPRAVFQHKHKEKPPKENSPGFKYTPKYYKKVPGGSMYGRWKDIGESEIAPEMQDLTGLTRMGIQKRIPLSLKSRHTPFMHNIVSTVANAPIDDPCRNMTYY